MLVGIGIKCEPLKANLDFEIDCSEDNISKNDAKNVTD